MLQSLLHLIILVPLAFSSPLPRLITRQHTAEAVTTTETHTTGTTTIQLPPVLILISNGVTYTSTMSQSAATIPTTVTSVVSDATPTSEAHNDAQQDTNQDTNQVTNQDPTQGTTQGTTQNAAQDTAQDTEAPDTNTTPSSTMATTTKAAPVVQPTNNQDNDTGSNNDNATVTHEASPETHNGGQGSSSPTPSPENTQETNDGGQGSSSPTTSPENTQETNTNREINVSVSIGVDTSSDTPATPTSDSTPSISGITSETDTIKAPHAIVYSPYNDDGTCKDDASVNSDLDYINSKGIKHIRTYGADCNTLSAVLPKAAQLGMKVNQGFWISPDGVNSIDSAVDAVIQYGQQNGYDVFDFFTIGNEAVNDHFASVSDLISKIASVKSKLQDAGYSGQVTTAEPPVSFINNPSLCTESDIDFVSINPHSYFDSSIDASQAGSFIMDQKRLTEKACGSKSVFISETGYPSQGNTNGLNIPSAENQEKAIKSIIKETGGDVTVLTTFNDYWKDPGQYGIEPYFGAITLFE